MKLYPLKFEPIYKHRIWGGDGLRRVFGRQIPAGQITAESWELVDLGEEKSVVSNGELAGRRIDEVLQEFGSEITGPADFGGQFPLMVKFLDVGDRLSIQVHPDADVCQSTGKGAAKTECWYIVEAAKEAMIYTGPKESVRRDEFEEAVREGRVLEMLEAKPVRAGECYFIPAGQVHGIGPGVLIAEVETPSDTTYRIYDWDRVDKDGKKRQLHIKEAMESVHFGAERISPTVIGRLVDCEFFKVDKGHQAKDCQMLLSGGKMRIMIILSGGGAISDIDNSLTEFKAGETVLLPAVFEGVAKFFADTEYLMTTV